MRTIRISEKAARDFLEAYAHPTAPWQRELDSLVAELRRATERLDRTPAKRKRSAKTSPELMAALKALLPEHKSRKPTKAERRDETAAIRETCLERAGAFCECGCGGPLAFSEHATPSFWANGRPELDHMFGRGKGRLPQSVETCWILRADCHRAKTRNEPDAATWWRRFLACLARHPPNGAEAGHAYWRAWNAAVARLRFVETRSALPASPRTAARHRREAEEKIRELELKVHKAVFTEEG